METNTTLLKKVKDALAKEPQLRNNFADIYTLVNDGAVLLAGSVENDSLRKLARTIVYQIPGVTLLIEDLRVEPHKKGAPIYIDFGRKDIRHYPGR